MNFTTEQITTLRNEFGKIERIDPTGETYPKLKAFLAKQSAENLKMLANADIKWISSGAVTQLILKGWTAEQILAR